MQPVAFTLESILMMVWQASWQAACLAVLIWCVVRILGHRIAAHWRFVLWSLVFVRLALPLLPPSPTSAFQLLGTDSTKTTATPAPVSMERTVAPTPSGESSSERIVDVARPPVAIESAPATANETEAHATTVESAVAAPDRRTSRIDWLTVTSIGWALVACSLLIRRGSQHALLLRKSRHWRSADPERVGAILARCTQRLGITASVEVLLAHDETGPAVMGTWRPRIVIPESVLREFTDEQLELIFCHELAHIRRRDLLLQELFLFVRCMHWFNPVAWWVLQRIQLEREMACDELVLEMTGDGRRQSYGLTLLQIAQQTQIPIATPGLLGTSDTPTRLQRRLVMIRDYRPRSWRTSLIAVTAIATVVAVGLTSPPAGQSVEQPKPKTEAAAEAQAPPTAPTTMTNSPPATTVTNAPEGSFEIKGTCVDEHDHPLADVDVSLFYFERYGAPAQQKSQQKTNAAGEYHFQNLRPVADTERSAWTEFYMVMAKKPKHASSGRMVYASDQDTPSEITLASSPGTLSGRVTNERGEPLSNAEVQIGPIVAIRVPGFHDAVTDNNGRFSIPDLRSWKPGETSTVVETNGSSKTERTVVVSSRFFSIKHRDFPVTVGKYSAIPQEVNVVLKPGIIIEGLVVERGKPVAGAQVSAQAVNHSDRRAADDIQDSAHVLTAADGSYRLVLRDDLYNIRAQTKDRMCVALDSFTGKVGEVTKAPLLELIEGGFIVGRVIDDSTGTPVSTRPEVSPFRVAHHGPGFPDSGASTGGTYVEKDGTYRLRVAPGSNYVYLSDRPRHNTQITLRNGETVTFDFHINGAADAAAILLGDEFLPRRPLIAPVIKNTDAPRDDVPSRPATPVGKLLNRLDELRENPQYDARAKVLRELIQLGPEAVPELIAEMDRSDSEHMLRCLAFVMRGIGDKRAVPALIRALPKTCVSPRSDGRFDSQDPQLLAFMQKHDMNAQDLKGWYSIGRAISEFRATLQKLTGSNHGEAEITGVFLKGSLRQQFLQRSLYQHCAERWAAWWQEHWKEHVTDPRYAQVNVPKLVGSAHYQQSFLPNATYQIDSRSYNCIVESVLNPQATCAFQDLDTGRRAGLPDHLKMAAADPERLDDILAWASGEGFDLMGTEYTPPGSNKSHYVIRGLGLTAWQIETKRWKTLEAELDNRKPLKMGTRTAGLLAQLDSTKGRYLPEQTATFLFQTREGGLGCMFVGVEVHDDSLKPGGMITGEKELSPIAFFKGRRYAYALFSESIMDDQLKPRATRPLLEKGRPSEVNKRP